MNAISGKRKWAAAAIVVLALGGGGAAVYRFASEPKRLAVVEEGVLLRSSQPSLHQLDCVAEEYEISSVVVARSGHSKRVPEEQDHARRRGLKVLHLQIESDGLVSDADARAFLDWVDDPANRPVWVHCSAGRHRTGYLCAVYRIERQGWSVERAVEEMLSYGFDVSAHGNVLEQLRRHEAGRFRKGGAASRPTSLWWGRGMELDDRGSEWGARLPTGWFFEGTEARKRRGTKARRHEGTEARSEEGTKARRHEGTEARSEEGTKARRQGGTEERWDARLGPRFPRFAWAGYSAGPFLGDGEYSDRWMLLGLGGQILVGASLAMHWAISRRRKRYAVTKAGLAMTIIGAVAVMIYAARLGEGVFILGQLFLVAAAARMLPLTRLKSNGSGAPASPSFPIISPETADRKIPRSEE